METAQEALTRDLLAYLVRLFYDVPAPLRRRSRWVMNLDWWNECRMLAVHLPPRSPSDQDVMFGLPVYVTKDGGFPHLIAD